MSFLQGKTLNQILLVIFAAAFIFFLYKTFTEEIFNLLFAFAALLGFIRTYFDLKKINAKDRKGGE